MRLFAKDAKGLKVHDLDTGKDLKLVTWVDVEQGLAEVYQAGPNGKPLLTTGPDGKRTPTLLLLKGRFKLLPADPKPDDKLHRMLGASTCALCGSSLTLQDDELCPTCKAKDKGKKLKCEPLGPFEQHKCERCSRDATWSTSDEVVVSPQKAMVKAGPAVTGGAWLFERAQTVGRRFYCSRHYLGPRLLDWRGEVVQTVETELRPQW